MQERSVRQLQGRGSNAPDSALPVEKRRSRPKLVDCLRWVAIFAEESVRAELSR